MQPKHLKGFVERLNCTYKNKTYQITYSGQTIPVDKPIDQAFLSSNLGKYCISQKTGYVFDIRFSASTSHSNDNQKTRKEVDIHVKEYPVFADSFAMKIYCLNSNEGVYVTFAKKVHAIVGLSSPDRQLRFPDENLNEKRIRAHCPQLFNAY